MTKKITDYSEGKEFLKDAVSANTYDNPDSGNDHTTWKHYRKPDGTTWIEAYCKLEYPEGYYELYQVVGR